jgi:NAD(P)-dependent dehydrogenase (short-subunit alcohol dehydrogenase family)
MSNFTKDSTATEVAATLANHIAGKVILITGCSPNGLGATAAMAIASHNPALIILAGRNQSLIEETQKTLLEKVPNLKIRILIFDLGSLKSVRDAAAEVNNYPEKIDVLINNAAIMASPFSKTVDGFESQFGINHLGPFLFTMLVVDKLNRGGRVVNVSSVGYAFGGVRFDDPNFEVKLFLSPLPFASH